jgi:hypothetical protein
MPLALILVPIIEYPANVSLGCLRAMMSACWEERILLRQDMNFIPSA